MKFSPEFLLNALKSDNPQVIEAINNYVLLEQKEKCLTSFRYFVEVYWDEISTTPLQANWYIDALCETLQATYDYNLARLLISLPPRTGKSSIVNCLFPAWLWAKDASLKFMCSSYSQQNLSERDSNWCRKIIQSNLYKQMFGQDFHLVIDNSKKLTTNKLGIRLSTSIGGSNTGSGSNYMLVDDPLNVLNAYSEVEKNKVIDWYTRIMASRIDPLSKHVKIISAQRICTDDLIGFILGNNQNKTWEYLCLPYEFKSDTRCKLNFNGWVDPRKREGEPLHSLFDENLITELKSGNGLGIRQFEAQYNCNPVNDIGGYFHRDWFQNYDVNQGLYWVGEDKVERHNIHIFTATDLAISLKQTADWSVAITFGRLPDGRLLVLDIFRDKLEGPDLLKKMHEIYNKWRPSTFLVESVAYQKLFLQLMREDKLPAKEVKPEGLDKSARARRFQCLAESKMVFLPKDASWKEDLLNECLAFPGGKNDDLVDACFIKNTLISTNKGKIPIQNIKKGDLVLTRRGWFPVLNCGATGIKSTITIKTKEGLQLTGTPNHPIFSIDGFKPMNKLMPDTIISVWNQQLLNTQKPQLAQNCVESIKQNKPEEVFNLTVAECPEYFANDILVHNCGYAGIYIQYMPHRKLPKKLE